MQAHVLIDFFVVVDHSKQEQSTDQHLTTSNDRGKKTCFYCESVLAINKITVNQSFFRINLNFVFGLFQLFSPSTIIVYSILTKLTATAMC